MDQKYVIMWENSFSRETGYVGKVTKTHFENTFEIDKARKFPSKKAAENMIQKLIDLGEGENNTFSCISL